MDRRRFLTTTASAIGALGLPIPFLEWAPTHWTPIVLGQDASLQALQGKPGLRVLSDRPVNAETPATLLDDDITPNARHFVRNNGILSERAQSGSLDGWSLRIDGETEAVVDFSMADLKSQFEHREAAIVIECAGNGRAGFNPPASGNQWTLGAVGCSLYEGVRLQDVLKKVGLKSTAQYLAFYGDDAHLSRDPSKEPISRGFPIEKALDPHTLLAWSMNGEPLPAHHGFPLRLVCPGWAGSTCGKWLTRLWIRDQVHDGAKMTGSSYRVPKYPVAPGTEVPDADMEIIEEMPVKSLITFPGSGVQVRANTGFDLRGAAWSGTGEIDSMDLSYDFGRTWIPTNLRPARNRYAWRRWSTTLSLPKPGYYEIWARATDPNGQAQPMVVGPWNPKGYLNNAMQRIAVQAL